MHLPRDQNQGPLSLVALRLGLQVGSCSSVLASFPVHRPYSLRPSPKQAPETTRETLLAIEHTPFTSRVNKKREKIFARAPASAGRLLTSSDAIAPPAPTATLSRGVALWLAEATGEDH